MVFLTVAAVGYLSGADVVGTVFAALGLLAAFLNAAFGLCLGCEAYLAIRRLSARASPEPQLSRFAAGPMERFAGARPVGFTRMWHREQPVPHRRAVPDGPA